MALSVAIKRHPLVTFFALAYALSWCAVPWAGPKLLPWGPALAAVIVLAVTEGRTGLRDLVRPNGTMAVGLHLVRRSIEHPHHLRSGRRWAESSVRRKHGELDLWTGLLLLIPLLLILGGQWEEPGWTGYALPRLQTGRSAMAASLILSILRLGWHLPLLLYGGITWADSLFIIASQFVATWLYNSTHRSVFIVMVLHLMQNITGGFFNPAFSGDDAVTYAWLRGALYAVIAIGVDCVDRRSTCHEDPRHE